MNLKLTKYTNAPGTFEAEWLDDDKTVRVIAYSGDQVGLFRSDVAQYGGEIDEALLAEVQAEWVPPPPPPVVVPTVVTIRQARLALLTARLLDDIDAAVAASGREAQIEWEYATEVRRDHPLIAAMQASKGLTDAEIDALFSAAVEM